jgi:hypothetical protein
MKLRRRISRCVNLMLLPAICCAISGYFGYSFLFGDRGVIAWRGTQDQLAAARHDLLFSMMTPLIQTCWTRWPTRCCSRTGRAKSLSRGKSVNISIFKLQLAKCNSVLP